MTKHLKITLSPFFIRHHLSLLLVCVLLIYFLTHAFIKPWLSNSNNSTILIHVPYIEADGYVDTMTGEAVVSWISPNKVIYGVNSTGRKNSFTDVKRTDLEASKQVNILDVTTKESSLYKKGQLLKYKNGKILIRLAVPTDDISRYLYGDLGSETTLIHGSTVKIPFHYIPPINKCPSDVSNGESYNAWRLSYGHGCLRLPSKYSKDRRWIYYQTSGQKFELRTSADVFAPRFNWINWKNAYVIDSRLAVAYTDKLQMLSLNGDFDSIDLNIQLQHVKPTKAGIIGVDNNKANGYGLKILRGGSTYQLTTGKVRLTEVSPEGCKVAYVTDRKLRVIDVCSLFN